MTTFYKLDALPATKPNSIRAPKAVTFI